MATHGKSFEMWTFPLVHSLTIYCSYMILRLCQYIFLLKAEVAELLLPYVVVNIAGRKDLVVDLHKLISV